MMLIAIFAMGLSGCSLTPSLSLTQEQSDLVAEYAAGLVVKYQKGHEMGFSPVTEDEPVTDTNQIPVDSEMIESEGVIPEDSVETTDSSEDIPVVSVVSENSSVSPEVPMGQIFGVTGFDVSYSNYEFQKIYPPQESADLVFSMQASPGMELLIIHFNVTNGNETVSAFNSVDTGVKARVVINGGERIPAQTTILMNDLLMFSDEVAPYGMVDAVLVFEVPEDTQQTITSLDLILVDNDGDNSYKLM